MIIAYCHLVAIVALAVRHLNETCRTNASLVNGELFNRPLTRLDPDNDSLAVSDVRVTTAVEPELRSRRLQDGRSPVGGAPVVVPQRPNSATADIDDDLLLSHSV
jgi:hypothetical protein